MFKKKLIILSSAAGLLAIIYVLTFVLSPEMSSDRAAAYRWLTARQTENIDRIEVSGANTVSLNKLDGSWFVVVGEKQFPAKQSRVDELFDALTTSGAYAVRGSTREIQEKTGTADGAPRIALFSGDERALELIVGAKDASGSSVHLRKAGDDAVRGGKDLFSGFTNSARSSWADLRLFAGGLDAASIQRITVFPPPSEGEGAERPPIYTIARDGGAWKAGIAPVGISGTLDSALCDTFARNIAEASADDFSVDMSPDDAALTPNSALSRVELELGDGRNITLTLGAEIDGKKPVAMSGMPNVWLFSQWTAGRIFREASGLYSE